MAPSPSPSRIRIAVARLLFTEKIDVGALYSALGIDVRRADPEALTHLAGVLDGIETAAESIRDHTSKG